VSPFDDIRSSGHPERFGWVKCVGCGAHRPPNRIATANGAIAGVCMEGCAALTAPEDRRRDLRGDGRPGPNDDVEGPVVRPVAAETSIESVITGHLEPRLLDPVICPHGNRRDSDCPRCAEMRALVARWIA
jgi:hypothetical protein